MGIGGLGHLCSCGRTNQQGGFDGKTALSGRGEKHSAAPPPRFTGGCSLWALPPPLGLRRLCRVPGRWEDGALLPPGGRAREAPRRCRGREAGEGASPPAFPAESPAPQTVTGRGAGMGEGKDPLPPGVGSAGALPSSCPSHCHFPVPCGPVLPHGPTSSCVHRQFYILAVCGGKGKILRDFCRVAEVQQKLEQ